MLKHIKELLSNYKLMFSKDFNDAFCDYFHLYYKKDKNNNERVEIHLHYDKKVFFINFKDLSILCQVLNDKKNELFNY